MNPFVIIFILVSSLFILYSNPLPEKHIIKTIKKKCGKTIKHPLQGKKHKTCAVVANGSSNLDHNCGHDIQSNEAVFRMNGAPVYGFEKYIGTKTTYRVSYGVNCVHPGQYYGSVICDDKIYDLHLKSSIQYLFDKHFEETKNHFNLYQNVKKLVFELSGYTDINDKKLIWTNYDTLQQKLNMTLKNIYPSTGFKTVLSAITMCENIKIYGFDYTQLRAKSHYFGNYIYPSKKEGFVHTMNDEWNIISNLIV